MNTFVKLSNGRLQVVYKNKHLKKGVSGLMRVRNEADFVGASIDSCINALDELIIVYNDCTDTTPQIVKEKAREYPDKIKVYEYPYKVYGVNLSKEEYDYIISQPLDSPHRLCNYYNFALSKVNYRNAVKIDADQIYFTEKLKYWCDIYSGHMHKKISLRSLIGIPILFWIAFNIRKWKNNKKNHYLKFVRFSFFRKCYLSAASYVVQHFKSCISLSGLNVVEKDKEWYVPLGHIGSVVNLYPPFNGTGDHLIFSVGSDTYYEPADDTINTAFQNHQENSYTSIEVFHKNAPQLFVGTCWFHVTCMRKGIYNSIISLFKLRPGNFIRLSDFSEASYFSKISHKMDSRTVPSYELFQFLAIYKDVNYVELVKRISELLEKNNH